MSVIRSGQITTTGAGNTIQLSDIAERAKQLWLRVTDASTVAAFVGAVTVTTTTGFQESSTGFGDPIELRDVRPSQVYARGNAGAVLGWIGVFDE